MGIMRVIAKAGQYRVEQDLSGSILFFKGTTCLSDKSAIEAIRGVVEPDIRAELVKQWERDQAKQQYAEKRAQDGGQHGSL